MKKSHYFRIVFPVLIALLTLQACEEGFLDEKPDRSMVVPQTLEDLQGLLDNTEVMTYANIGFISVISADNYEMSFQRWNSTTDMASKQAYVWAKDIYAGDNNYNDWKRPYQQIFYSNTVLDQLSKIDITAHTESRHRQIRGAACFYRAWAYFQLAQLYCKFYDSRTSASDPGLPLRLEADVTMGSVRSSVEETYRQILVDLLSAKDMLPEQVDFSTRPSKGAAFGLLARTHLQMEDYGSALAFADSCLRLRGALLDYRELDTAAPYPIAAFNEEVVFHSAMLRSSLLNPPNQRVVQSLYESYAENDLRKQAFFLHNDDGSVSFKGSYDGSASLFNGMTTAEMILIRAECLTRLGRNAEARQAVESLLRMRIEGDVEMADTEDGLLAAILAERRKELVMRGIRWMDLRRLNRSPATAVEIRRTVGEEDYVLQPNSSRYMLPIPDLVIALSGMPQNARE